MFSERVSHEGQNHLFCDHKISGLTNLLREICMTVDICRGSELQCIDEFSPSMNDLSDTVLSPKFKLLQGMCYLALWHDESTL